MSILSNHRQRWEPEHDEYLRQHRNSSLSHLATVLGRSKLSVERRRDTLGLSLPCPKQPPRALVLELAKKWAEQAKCSVAEVLGVGRRQHIAWARQQLMGELINRGYGYAGTARAMGFDHTTVLYAMTRIARECPKEVPLKPKARPVRLTFNPPPKSETPPSELAPSRDRLMGSR